MPKSKLRSSISIDEIDSIQATREKVSVESITVNNRLVKRPKFLRAQVSPGFRTFGSIETDEVEYDTYVNWTISPVPTITSWARAFGKSQNEEGRRVTVDDNGGIYVVGYAGNDMLLSKFSLDGDLQWAKSYDSGGYDRGMSIAVDQNGDIVVVGYSDGFSSGMDFIVMKLDSDGNTKWAKRIDIGDNDYGFGVAVADNGDIVLTGYISIDAKFRILVVKLDTDGNLQWAKSFTAPYDSIGWDIAVADNGDVVVIGYYELTSSGNLEAFVMRLDSDGNIKWIKTYGGTYMEKAECMTMDSSGSIVIAGYTDTFGTGQDGLVILLDQNGNVQWARACSSYDEVWFYGATIDSDGNVCVSGYVGYDGVVLKFNQNGNLLWSKSYGGSGDETIYDVKALSNGYLAITGYTNSYGQGGRDVLVAVLTQDGIIDQGTTNTADVNVTAVSIISSLKVQSQSPSVTAHSPTVESVSFTVTDYDGQVTEL